MSIATLHQGQRVHVVCDEAGRPVNAIGTVFRVHIRDNGASVKLDRRHKDEAVHPFPAKDDRGTLVRVYPDGCELPTKTGKDRRRAKRAPAAPGVADFGRDHWSALLYAEVRCTDNGGEPDRRHMRCLDSRHPQHSHGHNAEGYPTRLAGARLLPHHDDWDCVDDLARVGFLVIGGTGAYPVWEMTDEGRRVAGLLRAHKQTGGGVATFALE
jgi:hypothetical protein